MKPVRRIQKLLGVGFALIAVLLIMQDLGIVRLNHVLEERSDRIQRDSIASVEQLGRIARDVEREQILLGDHVLAETPSQMAPIEQELSDNRRDLQSATETYDRYVELPHEAELWAKAQQLIHSFQEDADKIIAVSRLNHDLQARRMMVTLEPIYAELDLTLSSLVGVNRAGALQSIAEIQSARTFHERTALAVTILVFSLSALMAGWLFRSVLRYERQRNQYAAELSVRNRDLDAFAARVAHDVRNALAPLSLVTGVLRKVAADPSRVLATADRLEEGVRKASGLVEALLAFSRGRREPTPGERCEVVPVLRSVLQEVEPVALRIDATIVTNEIPEATVRCGPSLLHIIVGNVVGNAVKYLQDREQRRVSLSGRIEGGFYVLSVADTGPGIAPDDIQRIFEPFYRVEGVVAPGTGIGLTTVRRILDAHRGRIEVESKLGEGSTFRIWLPLAREAAAPWPEQPPSSRSRERPPSRIGED